MQKHDESTAFHLFERKEGSESPDLWLISYADLMTLLYVFFVVMYSLSSIDEKKLERLSQEFAKSFGATVKDTPRGLTLEEREVKAFRTFMKAISPELSAEEAVERIERLSMDTKSFERAKVALTEITKNETSSIQFKENRIDIVFSDIAMFHSGSALLTPKARHQVARLALVLSTIQNVYDIEVVGHTDGLLPARASLFPNNWALSAARAGAVASELIRHGLRSEWVHATGRANLQPIAPEYTQAGEIIPANLEKNRRVQITIRKRYETN